jgi:hypothetical protein
MTENHQPADSSANSPIHSAAVPEMKVVQPLYQKAAGAFQSQDLDGLQALEEGWFVEFKDRIPDTAKLARSISSFANSHGGLLVIGAKEEQKTRRLGNLTPMSRADADQTMVRAREAVTAHVTPPPYFEAKAVAVASLDSDVDARWIVVISVPRGDHGPYLHSNGCIYVRVGDAASPHALADLTQQERLWANSLGRKTRIKSRIEELSKQFQVGTPSIHLVILADDPGSFTRSLTFEDFRELALAPNAQHSCPIFDQVQTLDTSLLARRTEQQVDAAGLFWDFDLNRRLHFIQIPIATHFWSGQEFDNRGDLFNLPELGAKLRERSAPEQLMILNLLPALYFLSVIIWKVKAVHQREGYTGQLKFNACAVECKGTTPFLGTPAYFSEVEATGFPYVMRDVGFFSPLDAPSNWPSFEVHHNAGTDGITADIDVVTSFGAFSRIGKSLGVSTFLSLGHIESGDDESKSKFDPLPLVNLFLSLQSSSFSFTSQNNPKATRTV